MKESNQDGSGTVLSIYLAYGVIATILLWKRSGFLIYN